MNASNSGKLRVAGAAKATAEEGEMIVFIFDRHR
jgi:hypothetical protein